MHNFSSLDRTQHGTLEFPVEYYYVDRRHPRYQMPFHWHNEWEILRVLDGTLEISLDDEQYSLGQGDILLIRGGVLHGGEPENCVYECLVFDASFLRRAAADGAARGGLEVDHGEHTFVNFIARADGEIHALFASLFDAMRTAQPYYELRVIGLLYELFFLLFSHGYIVKRTATAPHRGVRTVLSVLEWIEAHYAEPITLSRLAAQTGLSEKYLCRLFKEYTAKTVMDYVNERRIERACVAMETVSVTDAAFDCGFNHLSYFCKTFKKHKGMTPSQYKRSCQK